MGETAQKRGRRDVLITDVSYVLINPHGAPVMSYNDEALARKRLFERRHEIPGAYIERWTSQIVRERVYTPGLRVVE